MAIRAVKNGVFGETLFLGVQTTPRLLVSEICVKSIDLKVLERLENDPRRIRRDKLEPDSGGDYTSPMTGLSHEKVRDPVIIRVSLYQTRDGSTWNSEEPVSASRSGETATLTRCIPETGNTAAKPRVTKPAVKYQSCENTCCVRTSVVAESESSTLRRILFLL